jgi:hypothetical protein
MATYKETQPETQVNQTKTKTKTTLWPRARTQPETQAKILERQKFLILTLSGKFYFLFVLEKLLFLKISAQFDTGLEFRV